MPRPHRNPLKSGWKLYAGMVANVTDRLWLLEELMEQTSK